ncbi:cytochrome c oxidase subunit 3 [Candidatus Palauibacter sp.]|jgi:heme/copper-type cytochrome/quinol oxidase subunit 3|uniref:cytochrome c oxidase subunit 3 n=1 Tax=Candidatus Palauibacter sp. TaxID=3101350 RepID=UPI003AF3173A
MAHAATADRVPERGIDVYTQKVGMWVFLCSEVMFFAGLIGSYVVLRFGAADTWANPGDVLNVPVTAVNTFILICSSVTMVKAFAAAQEGDQRGIKLYLLLTTLLGALFLGVQVYEYTELVLHASWQDSHGFTPAAGLYGATFFTMTGFHGFHVLLGVICLAWATIRAHRGHWGADNTHGIEVLGLYWHFVDLVWIILFTIVYLI